MTMPVEQQMQEFTASHWKRMAHMAVTYKQPGCDDPLRAFLTRAYIDDGGVYNGKKQVKKFGTENPLLGGDKSRDSLEPEVTLGGEEPTLAAKVEVVAEHQDVVADRLADLCISGDSGASCDYLEESEATATKEHKEADGMVSDDDSGETDDPDAIDDAEVQLMAQMGLPTNFVVRQRRQNRPRQGIEAGNDERKPNKRHRQQQKPDSEAAIAGIDGGEGEESPKRRKSIPGADEKMEAETEDDADSGGLVYAGPYWPDYEWISDEFQRHWTIKRDRCIWLAWVRRFGPYMTEETWSGMPPSLRDDEEFLLLRRELLTSTAATEPGGLPVQDWGLEWQRNEETAYWAEMLRFAARYRPGTGAKLAAMRLARRLGFAYAARPDLEQLVTSHYDLMPGGQTISRVSYKNRPTEQRDKEQEAATAQEALGDPHMNKYWNQRYRFFDLFDQGIQLDREAWFSVTPQRIARHQAERLKCTTGLLVDAFCGAGGNAIQFAQMGGHVVAIDIDATRLAMAEHNVGVYGVSDRVSFLCADFFDAAPRLSGVADAIFLSPPWGGPSYLERDVFDLDAPVLSGERSIADCVRAALAHCRNVAIYLPRNADLGQLARLLGGCRAGIVEVEQNLLNGRFKAITVYTGGLVDAVTSDY